MGKANTQPARGMRDFLPADVRRRDYVIGVVKEVYERYGFEPLETPAVENIETLLGKYGEEGNQLIYKILKRGEHEKTGEADLALRYDLTVPLARVIAQYQNELPKFFKRYQIQPVWRADRPGKGRFREFYQCDVDVLGSKSMVVEAELCAAVSDVLMELGLPDFEILLNHREVLKKIMTVAEVEPAKLESAFVAWDKLDKIGIAGVRTEWERRGIYLGAYDHLIRLLFHDPHELSAEFKGNNEGWNEEMLKRLPDAMGGYEQPGLDELKLLLDYAAQTSARGRVRLAPDLARGISYYTGSIMEIKVEGMPSLGGGGRYDNLVGMFLGKDVPACGFSLGMERIIVMMDERGLFKGRVDTGPADVMVTIWDETSIPESLRLARELRAEGLQVIFYPEVRKPSKQLFYADNRRIRFRIIVGPLEIQSGSFKVRDKQGGEEILAREEIAATLLNRLHKEAETSKKRREGFQGIIEGNRTAQ